LAVGDRRPPFDLDRIAACRQVTTLDRAKLGKKIGLLSPDLARNLEAGLKAALDLD
jgi:mRNA-degrading endonuclease toxin of MazEF toxin-antitoxin module